jgi:tetratricopeptide (TPR) repeat protein
MMDRLALLVAMIITAFGLAPLQAEDVVFVAGARRGQPPAQWKGQIINYTGKELELRTSLGTIKKIAAARIVKVNTPLSEDHQAADAFLAQGKHAAALARYDVAGKKDGRQWMRRRIIAQKVWCHRALGQYDRAGGQFIILYQSDPTTALIDCVPLAWGAEPFSRSLERQAGQWMAEGQPPIATLLGASHLLGSALRAEALDRLGRLANDRDPNIAVLAQTQVWRSQVVTATPQQITAWQRAIEKMPEPLCAGPYYVLGQALARNRQFEEAALAYLHIATLYENNLTLSAAALLEAGGALQALSRNDEARDLYQQLVREHPHSQAAADARERLGKLQIP